MTLNNKLPRRSLRTTLRPLATESAELAFSGDGAPSAKLTLNINAFNGNKTNFGGRRNGNK
jgi:hypothetical protein